MNDEKDTSSLLSRRTFVGSVAAAAGFMIVPRRVLGGPGYQAPSDRVQVATVGYINGMGTSNTNAVGKVADVVALCDCDESAAALKNAARTKIFESFPKAVRYKDYRVMLEKQKDIDGVIVATPDHAHAVIAMAAMQLGKHVYVQKPLTRTVSEARALTEAARKYKVITQMGNQGRSGEGVRLIGEWLDDGAIGDVTEVHCWTNRPIWPQGMQRPTDTPPVPDGLDWDLWIGPSPMRPYHTAYHPFSWRAWWDFGAGALGDMACHVMDASYSMLQLGYPTSVTTYLAYNVVAVPREGGGTRNQRIQYNDSFPPACMVHYTFPARGRQEEYPPVKLHWYDGGLLPERPEELELDRRLPESGTIFVGEEGQADVRDVLREPAPHPREQDAGLQAAEEDGPAHRGQPRAELDRGDPGQGAVHVALRLLGPVHRDGVPRQRRRDVPGPEAAVGRQGAEVHEQRGGQQGHPAQLPRGLVALGPVRTGSTRARRPSDPGLTRLSLGQTRV